MFHVEDYPESKVEYWEALAVQLDPNCLDDLEADVWAIARESKTPPHLGNVYLNELLSSLERALIQAFPDNVTESNTDRFINAQDSHFYIGSVAVYNDETLKDGLIAVGVDFND